MRNVMKNRGFGSTGVKGLGKELQDACKCKCMCMCISVLAKVTPSKHIIIGIIAAPLGLNMGATRSEAVFSYLLVSVGN
jgi:hypothetical protein